MFFSGCCYLFWMVWAYTSLAISPSSPKVIAANNPHLQYIGRFDLSNPQVARFGWSGSTIKARFTGTSLSVLLKNYSTIKDGYGKPQANYFDITIDGGSPITIRTENDGFVYPVAFNLPAGEHTVEIFKRTEASVGVTEFHGLQLSPEGKLLPPPARKTRKIEFIGDSITCGYGIEGDSARCKFSPETENHYHTYAAVAARMLKAEHTAIAFSGIGLWQNYGGKRENTMPDLYTRIYPQNDSVLWDFNAWQPDAVVINLGTNDFAKDNPPQHEFSKVFKKFIQLIKKKYPKSAIFCVLSPMVTDSYPKPQRKRSTLNRYLRTAIYELSQSGDAVVHYTELSEQGQFGYGCDFHPNKRQQQQNGKELAAFMKVRLGWN